MSNNLFLYWENLPGRVMPPFIAYCKKSFEVRSGLNIHFITPENVEDYIKDTPLHPNWRLITNLPEKCDVIRIALLYQYGGMYCDMDTICLKDLNHMFEGMYETKVLRWACTDTLLNAYIISKPKTPYITAILQKINDILQSEALTNYAHKGGGCYMGQCRLNACQGYPHLEIPLHTFIPFEFPPDRDHWYMSDTIDRFIQPDTVAIALNLSQMKGEMLTRTVSEHIATNNFFGSCFKFSESLGSLL